MLYAYCIRKYQGNAEISCGWKCTILEISRDFFMQEISTFLSVLNMMTVLLEYIDLSK